MSDLNKLNKGLMNQFERLENHQMDEFELKNECERAKAMSRIGKEVVASAKIQFQASLMYPSIHGPKPPKVIGHE